MSYLPPPYSETPSTVAFFPPAPAAQIHDPQDGGSPPICCTSEQRGHDHNIIHTHCHCWECLTNFASEQSPCPCSSWSAVTPYWDDDARGPRRYRANIKNNIIFWAREFVHDCGLQALMEVYEGISLVDPKYLQVARKAVFSDKGYRPSFDREVRQMMLAVKLIKEGKQDFRGKWLSVWDDEGRILKARPEWAGSESRYYLPNLEQDMRQNRHPLFHRERGIRCMAFLNPRDW